jgi:hypothetical protein
MYAKDRQDRSTKHLKPNEIPKTIIERNIRKLVLSSGSEKPGDFGSPGRCGVANGLTLDLETGVRNCAWDSRMKKRKK